MAWYDDILGTGSNIFGAQPADYLVGKEGLLNPTEQQKLSQRAFTSGLLGTAITYLAQPKNQRYGSALPYLGKAFLTGMGRSQDVYDKATQDYLTKTKIEDIQTTKAKEKQLKDVLSTMGKTFDVNTFDSLVKTGNLDAAKQYADIFKTTKEITAEPKAGYKVLTKDEVKALNEKGYNLNPAATWQFNATTGQYDPITGTMPSKETPKDIYRTLTNDEAIKAGLDTSRGQKYQVNSSNNINLIGGQIAPQDKVRTPQTVSTADRENVNILLDNAGITTKNDVLTTAVASRANKLMTDEGLDQTSAIQKSIEELRKSKALKTYQNTILGFPTTKSTEFDITKSSVPSTSKKPLRSFEE